MAGRRQLILCVVTTSVITLISLVVYTDFTVLPADRCPLETSQSLGFHWRCVMFVRNLFWWGNATDSTEAARGVSSTGGLWATFSADKAGATIHTHWQGADHNTTFLYSAYYDDVSTPVVRVIAIVAEGLQDSTPHCLYFAQFPPPPSGPFAVRTGRVQFVPEPRWGFKYRSAAVICPLETGDNPQAVSVVPPAWRESDGVQPLNVMHVRWHNYSNPLSYNLTRCNPALHSNFSAVTPMVEMFTFSLKFGVDHFVMYTLNVGHEEQRVMDMYKSRGVLEVHRWNLPVPPADIHYFGQLANIQDCIYRHLHVSRYVMFGDVDEILVPRSEPTLLAMAWRWLRAQPRCGSLQFLNTFFPIQLPDTDVQFTNRQLAEKYRMATFLKTRTMTTGTSRQKFIIDPTRVEISGIHEVEVFRPGFSHCHARRDQGLVQHYRTVTDVSEVRHLQTAQTPVDTFLHKYTDVITTVASELVSLGYT